MERVATNIYELVSDVILDTKGLTGSWFSISSDSSIGLFLPEILICGTILLMLLVRLFRFAEKFDMFYIAFFGFLAAFLVLAPWRLNSDSSVIAQKEIFTGLMVVDGFSVFIRGLLFSFGLLFLVFTKLSGTPSRYDSADVYTLVLGATLGLCVMSGANHLLIIFMGVEMASVPSYVLAGLQKRDRKGSEAALKFAVYGAGAAGIMIYGISLLAGLFHTAHLPTLAWQMSQQLPEMSSMELMVAALAGLMIMAGLAYKLSAFPFHYWIPDVLEGAPAEVGAFLSIASKAAALALLVRVVLGVGFLPKDNGAVPTAPVAVVKSDHLGSETDQTQLTAFDETHATDAVEAEPHHPTHNTASVDGLVGARSFMAKLIALIAILTCTFGNLAAYGQKNIKRMLAYSTIAHAGFMMMGVPALLAATGIDSDIAAAGVSGIAIYLVIYMFMNLAAFAVVAFLRNEMGSEQIDDYAGLLHRCPGITICFVVVLFSLIGMPPMAGFIAKFAVLASVADAYLLTADSYLMWVLVVGVLNTAISLIYYLRVARVMTMLPEPDGRKPFSLPLLSFPGVYVGLLTLPVAFLIVNWESVHRVATKAAAHLLGS